MKAYEAPSDGLADAMRLSGAMTRKLAVAGLPFGGGKGVIAVPELPTGQRRRGLFERYGDLIESLGATALVVTDDLVVTTSRWAAFDVSVGGVR